MKKLRFLCVAPLLSSCGCTRTDRNSDCRWPAESTRPTSFTKVARQRLLRQDAQVAEDLAIRYADAHYGPHSGHFESWVAYNNATDSCMNSLFAIVATTEGVSVSEVRQAVTHRPLAFDFAVILSFASIYFLLANVMARRVWHRFPVHDGWVAGVIATIFASLAFSAAGVLAGEIWSGLAENIRVGNGHLSSRADRIPWVHHRLSFFIACIFLFWFVATFQRRRPKVQRPLSLLTAASHNEST